ncbi:hypothetical protein ACFV6E_29335 [Streptomyces sp. NPDC059785]|uniref:hypothetical protein n=1 Tax=Streptomyces sp. NPDC059785 TaxID=3346945 RepID=UPI00364BF2B3
MYAPGPAAPSPLGAFLGRTFRGDWAGAARAALWPVGLLLISAVALAIPSYGQDDDVVIGFGDRMQIALAVLLQALGGGFEAKTATGSRYADGGWSDFGTELGGVGQLSLIPLTVTALWIVALIVGARLMRTRIAARGPQSPTAGLEAAVRVALLVTGAVLLTGLFARPTVAGAVKVSSSPVLAALGALLLGLAVAGGVLHRDDLAQWLAARPAARAVVRATGTALRALTVVLALCSVVAFVCVVRWDNAVHGSDYEGSDGSLLLVTLFLLPNLAVMALGLSWGAPVEAEGTGSSPFGGGYEREAFGLGELGDVVNDWAVVGALALGLVSALVVGVMAARRSADRREQMTAAGVFFVLFLLLAGIGGFSAEAGGGTSDGSGYGSDYGSDYGSGFDGGYGSDYGSSGLGSGGDFGWWGTSDGVAGSVQVGLSLTEALLFGLLWVFAAAFLAPYLMRMAGARTHLVAPPVPPAPAGAPTGHLPFRTQVSDQTRTQALPEVPSVPPVPGSRRRTLVWVVTILVAFLVGGGAAAGVIVWQDHRSGGGSDKGAGQPRSAPTADRESGSSSPDAEPGDDITAAAEVPGGYHRLNDPLGFSFAVPEVWTRENVEDGTQVTYAGPTGMEHIKVGVIADAGYTSYENFLALEETAAKKDDDYRRVELEENTFQGHAGAVWEYTYTDESGRTVHAADQSYVADDGTEYAIMIVGRDDIWESGVADTFRVALETWQTE